MAEPAVMWPSLLGGGQGRRGTRTPVGGLQQAASPSGPGNHGSAAP
jgi:hypothetical protein